MNFFKLVTVNLRSVFAAQFHLQTVFCSTNHVSAAVSMPTNDEFLQNIRTSPDALHLFDLISGNEYKLTGYHVIQSLRSLYNFQKFGQTTLQASQILKHPEFEKLCRILKHNCRSIELSEAIASLKCLSYLGLSSNSEIMQILLNLIRHQINDIEINQILFLDFLLKKFESSPLVDALKIALPILLEINLSTKMDHENISQLTELLAFISKNRINDKCTMNVISCLTLHGTNLSPDSAISIIWSLCDFNKFKSSYNRLLENSFNSLIKNIDSVKFDQIEMTLTKVINKFIKKNPEFYNELFINKCAEMAVKCDVGFTTAIYILRKFNKISFANRQLLEYVTAKVFENPELLTNARPTVLFNFITSSSLTNFKTENWDDIKYYISKNTLMESNKIELPWFKLTLELMSLDYFDEKLINRIFENEFLNHHLGRNDNVIDYLQLLTLYQCVKLLYPTYMGKFPNEEILKKAREVTFDRDQFPLQKYLEYGFESDNHKFVKTKIHTEEGQLIDHFMLFNDKGEPVPLTDTADILEKLLRENYNPIAIISLNKNYYPINLNKIKGVFELKIKTLEAKNIKVLTLNLQQWKKLPEEDRLPFLLKEINQKLNEKT